jgi:RNA polymerase-binding transcription factor DksA
MALTASQTEELRRIIVERRKVLQAEILGDVARAEQEQYGELAGPVADAGDQSVADLLSDLDRAEVSRDLTEFRELEAALARLADGGIDRCADCGGEIGFERLSASPAATRCIDCQRVHEKTYAGAGEPTL